MSWMITPQFKTQLLLDQYPGAAAAYSLRNLTIQSYAPVVRVRRSSDNTESDFTATQISDGTLVTWVGAGNNGFVQTWYDQSGNGRHLAQISTVNQPQIVSNGSLLTEGAKATILHSASARWLFCDTSYSSAAHTVFNVVNVTGGGTARVLTVVYEQAVFRGGAGTNEAQVYGAGLVATQTISNGWPRGTRYLFSTVFAHADGDAFAYRNGSSIYSNTVGTGANATPSAYYLGGVSGGLEGFTGNVQELIIYANNQTSNRTAIESNINAYYSIY